MNLMQVLPQGSLQRTSIHETPNSRGSGLRILVFPKNGQNAYLNAFSSHLESRGAEVEDFNFRRAFFRHYDVVHMHWPDTHLRTHSWWRALGKHTRLALLCLILRARGTAVVWMLHNLKPHEKDHWISAMLFRRWFPRLCTHVMALTVSGLNAARQLYPALLGKPAIVVPHGHYRDAYPEVPCKAAARRELGLAADRFTFVFFGSIRRYKNVPLLIRQFRALDDRNAQLVVAGQPVLGMREEELRELAGSHERIQLHLKFISDEHLPLYLAAADKVVLPFDSILNSGSVLLALSFDRAVLAPRLGALPEIQSLVGSRWLQLYDGPLTPELLGQATEPASIPAQGEQPDLSAFDWDAITNTTLDFYRLSSEYDGGCMASAGLGESSSVRNG